MQNQHISAVSISPGLDIILGPMFSGKSTELIRILSTATHVNLKALYINHSLDKRNSDSVFSTHAGHIKKVPDLVNLNMCSVSNLNEIDDSLLDEVSVIGIDEGQFFEDLSPIMKWIEEKNKRVVIVSLDGDYKRGVFGHVLEYIPKCDSVRKLHSLCMRCAVKKNIIPALFTHKLSIEKKTVSSHPPSSPSSSPPSSPSPSANNDIEQIVDVGSDDKYESVCRSCYIYYTDQ
jgi:thymidine kinase